MLTFDKLCMGCMNDNGGEEICPICGFVAGTKNPADCLPVKTRIRGRYIVGKVLETNGEGITYIGWDNDESNIVYVREFFPVPLSKRNDDMSVEVLEGSEYSYNTALLDFIQLGKSLKGISAVAVPEVVDIIECNSTAYLVTKYAAGITLREFLLRNGGTLSWEQARPLFMPLISAIILLHKNGIIHGGISPETVIVGRDGKLRLTGFAIADLRKSNSAINSQLFPGYAAVEQYSKDEQNLSEATDVYGFAATLFRALMGSSLPEANERITDDKMSIPSKIAQALPQAVLVALANALQILFENRTKKMTDFKLDIAPAIDSTTSFVVGSDVAVKDKKVKTATAKKNVKSKDISARKYAIIAASITAGIFVLIALIVWMIVDNPFRNETGGNDSQYGSSMPIDDTPSTSTGTGDKLLTVPDFTALNLTFEEVCNEYADFKYVVIGKKYSSKNAGIVVAQDIKPGSAVKRDTTIYLTVSLGPETLTVPDITGMDEQAAMLELFKKGFLYYNITFYEIEDSSVEYHHVVKTDPAVNSMVNPEATIKVYYSSVKNQDQNPNE